MLRANGTGINSDRLGLWLVCAFTSPLSFHSLSFLKDRGREASKEILDLVNKMCLTVLKAKTPGDADTVINTTKITAILQKALANSLNGSIVQNELGLFRLPNLGLFQNMNFEDYAVNLQVR